MFQLIFAMVEHLVIYYISSRLPIDLYHLADVIVLFVLLILDGLKNASQAFFFMLDISEEVVRLGGLEIGRLNRQLHTYQREVTNH